MKIASILLKLGVGACLLAAAHAQTTNYFVDFEGASETKSGYASGTVTLSGLQWNMTESLIGNLTSDAKNGTKSARLRTNDVAVMTMLEDITSGAGTVSFLHAKYGSDAASFVALDYSTDGGGSWVNAGTASVSSTTLQLYSTNINVSGNVRLRLRKTGSSPANARANVDDITVLSYGPPPSPTTNVQFTAASASIGEAGGTYTVTVYKTLASGNVSGSVALSGTASSPADYTIDTTNFTMNGATTSATFVVTIVDDGATEGNETVILTLTNVTGGTISSPSVFTLTITDNDGPPPSSGAVWINEFNYDPPGTDSNEFVELAGPAGVDLADYRIVLYNGSGGAPYATILPSGLIPDEGCGYGALAFDAVGLQNGSPDGIALAKVDAGVTTLVQFLSYEGTFVGVGGPADGVSSTDVGTQNSSLDTLQLSGTGTNYADFTWVSNTVSRGVLNVGQTIDPCGGGPVTNVKFAVATANISEAGGAYTVTVFKTLSSGNVSGSVALSGTASSPADYTIDTTNFTLNGSVTSATFVITVVDDGSAESDETVVLTLTNVTGGTISSPSVFTLTINDNDAGPPPSGYPTNVLAYQRFEAGDPWTIEAGAANVSSATGAADFPPLQRIQEGVNSWQVNNGSVTLQLAQVSIEGYTNRLIKARVSSTSLTSGNGADVGDLVRFFVALDSDVFPTSFAVSLSGNNNARWGYWATNIIDVSATTSNSFAPAAGGTSSNNYSTIYIRIPDASTSVALRVTALNNDANEIWNLDNIEVLGDPAGPPPPPPTNVQFTASADTVGEDVGTYTVTVFKSLPSGNVSGSVALSGTATLGADYTIDTTNFTMNGAVTTATFVITVTDDLSVEPTETVILTLTGVTGGTIASPSVFTLSITNNDLFGPAPTTNVWINELHYDNTGTDVDEGVEIAGPAGLDLAGYSIWLYDGGLSCFCAYSNVNLSGVIPNQSNGFGAVWFSIEPIRNGPDGVALVYGATQVIQFLSYEGSFTVTDGPAAGMTSVDIGVSEPTATAVGNSLQLCGSGTNYAAFTWATNSPHSRGLLNACQTIPVGSPYSPAQQAYIIAWWGSVGAYTGDGADDDGDGFSNLEEFIAATIPVPPTGSNSFFRGIAITNGAARYVVVPTATGRQYRLWSATNLLGTQVWSQVAGPLPGTGTNLSLTDGITTNYRMFKLSVELENP